MCDGRELNGQGLYKELALRCSFQSLLVNFPLFIQSE